MNHLDAFKQHGDVIWNIANLLRGPYRPPQYRRVMIPLTVLRRLDCVLEESKDAVIALHKKLKAEKTHDTETIEKIINQKFKLPFHNVSEFTFAKLLGDPDKLAANLVNFMAGFSSRARKIIEMFKFEDEIEKLDQANRLFEVVKAIAAVDLHPQTPDRPDGIPNIAMGYVFEDLVRRFNEQANEEAGDHFTPREVIKLMVNLLFTYDDLVYKEGKVIKIYDPTAGTGGMLSESEKLIVDPERGLNPSAHLELFGQEYNPESYAICGSDLMIKGEDVKNIVYGNTLGTGKSKEGFVDGDGHPKERFHYMLANPPFGVEWKTEKDHLTKEHEQFGFAGRFGPGLPRINDGALLFLLHMISKMHPSPDNGGEGSRIAVVFNGSPLFTGDAGSGESNIRRWIIENDMLEALVGLPDQLFYNTGISTYIWIVTNRKRPERRGKVQLINGTEFAWKMKKSLGDKRKQLGDGTEGTPNHIEVLTKLYGGFKDGVRMSLAEIRTNVDPERNQGKELGVSKVFDNQEFGYLKITVERPLRLNFAVTRERIARARQTGTLCALLVSHKRKDKKKIKAEIQEGRDLLAAVLRTLRRMRPGFAGGQVVKDRAVFARQLENAFEEADISDEFGLKSALLAPGSLGERDPSAEICRNKKGQPEPDPELRDTENVPFPPDIALPLPLDYESKRNKGKVDVEPLLELVRDHCEAYLAAEVLPYRPDAWIDHSKIKVGYEIPFNPALLRIRAAAPAGGDREGYHRLGKGDHGHAQGGNGMSDIKLFRIATGTAKEIQGTASYLEKPLQGLIEANLVPLLGIRLVATEYSTGKTHAGRIDTLGLDENDSPVIIEYKRSSHENIINQGLFYLDWLMDHQAEFKLLVLEKFGKPVADAIDWSGPRLLCIAAEFTKYDSHAVQQMDRNIELLRYRHFGSDLLLLELVNAVATNAALSPKKKAATGGSQPGSAVVTVAEDIAKLPSHKKTVFDALDKFALSLGDDVQRKDMKLYVAYKRLRNFASVVVVRKHVLLYLALDPEKLKLEEDFSRDVREVGHWGTGHVEVTLKTLADLEKAKPLIAQAYTGGYETA
jgi:type I restriction enzyme M protein